MFTARTERLLNFSSCSVPIVANSFYPFRIFVMRVGRHWPFSKSRSSEMTPVAITISGAAAAAQNTPTLKTSLDHQRKKSEERPKVILQKKFWRKKLPSVNINIGIMCIQKDSLKVVRGRTLTLNVEPDIDASGLHLLAVKKMTDFHSDFPEGPYVLMYSDKTEVITIPGTSKPFSLREYRTEIEKPYNRITFFICLRAEYEQHQQRTSNTEVEICVLPDTLARTSGQLAGLHDPSTDTPDPEDSTNDPANSVTALTESADVIMESPCPVQKTAAYIVYEDCLLKLFEVCPVCQRVSDVKTKRSGSFISVVHQCSHCQFSREWNSQPVLGSSGSKEACSTISHQASKTGPQKTKSVGTQLSARTLLHRSKATQVKISTRDSSMSTVTFPLNSPLLLLQPTTVQRPSKRPRLSIKEEGEDPSECSSSTKVHKPEDST